MRGKEGAPRAGCEGQGGGGRAGVVVEAAEEERNVPSLKMGWRETQPAVEAQVTIPLIPGSTARMADTAAGNYSY